MAGITTTTFGLWGGLATVSTLTDDDAAHAQAVNAVTAWLDHVDRVASTYRDDSEISRLNGADGRPTHVGPVLRTAIHAALTAAERTDGLVDPTVGSVTLPAPGSLRMSRRTTFRDVLIEDDDTGAMVTMPPGCRLDLGATAKGWAADQAAQIAAAAGGAGALVNLLGDIATSGSTPASGWAIVVTDDHREGVGTTNRAAQTVAITSGGLATSGTTVRQRHAADGAVIPHIVDPRTLVPVVPRWRTVSVAATDCLAANTASTAAIVLGDAAPAWLRSSGLPARLIGVDGSIVCVNSWPTEQEQERERAA